MAVERLFPMQGAALRIHIAVPQQVRRRPQITGARKDPADQIQFYGLQGRIFGVREVHADIRMFKSIGKGLVGGTRIIGPAGDPQTDLDLVIDLGVKAEAVTDAAPGTGIGVRFLAFILIPQAKIAFELGVLDPLRQSLLEPFFTHHFFIARDLELQAFCFLLGQDPFSTSLSISASTEVLVAKLGGALQSPMIPKLTAR